MMPAMVHSSEHRTKENETMLRRIPVTLPTIQLEAINDDASESIVQRMQYFDAFSLSPRGVSCLKSPSRILPKPLPHSPTHTQEALLILNEIGRGSTAKVYSMNTL